MSGGLGYGEYNPLDAYQAAQSVFGRTWHLDSKTRDGYVEALQVLRTARTNAVRARTAVPVQINSLLLTAPESVRATNPMLRPVALVKALARTRPSVMQRNRPLQR